jgi:O-antigen/teichoic acid export membrane protein
MKISFGVEIFSKLLGIVTSIVLARLLLPSDYGIVAIVYLFLTALDLLSELGFSNAVIYRKENIEAALNTGFTLNLIISAFLFIIAVTLAPFLAEFYGNSNLTLVVRVLAISLFVSTLKFIPSTCLRKDLRFGEMATPNILTNLVSSVVSIFLAYLGYGYWSLVIGGLASSFLNIAMLFKLCPFMPKLAIDKQIAKEVFSYGKYLFLANIVIYINLNIDNAIGGKILGLTALGFYYIAYRWGTFSQRISGLTEGIMFPTYSKMQSDIEKIKKWYLTIVKYVSIIAFPISLGLFVIATEFIIIVLGAKWEQAITPLRILCFFGLVTTLSGTTGSVFSAIGKPKLVMSLSLIMTLAMLILIYPLTIYFGIFGLSIAVTISAVLSAIATFYYILKVLNMKLIECLYSIKSAVTSTIAALFFTILMKYIIYIHWGYPVSLITLIVLFLVFSLTYLISLYIFDKESIINFMQLLK